MKKLDIKDFADSKMLITWESNKELKELCTLLDNSGFTEWSDAYEYMKSNKAKYIDLEQDKYYEEDSDIDILDYFIVKASSFLKNNTNIFISVKSNEK